MVALWLDSSTPGSGKTTLAAGLGKHLLTAGKKVGFFKPVIAASKDIVNRDAVLMKEILNLTEPIEFLSPLFTESDFANGIKQAYARVSTGKDIVIVESVSEGNRVYRNILEALNARVVIVEAYSDGLPRGIGGYKDLGSHLLGLVVNKVPQSRIKQTSAQFDNAGAKALGALPEDRALLSLTVGELAQEIHGHLLSGVDKSAELVENIMLGAMYVDPGPEYYGRKINKAVVVRSERPDMQLAALETSTRCLVLCGKTAPAAVVLHRAETKNVPIIQIEDSVTNIAASIESALSKARFNQQKLPRILEIMERNFDFKALYKGLEPDTG